jgi:hypothetical protein
VGFFFEDACQFPRCPARADIFNAFLYRFLAWQCALQAFRWQPCIDQHGQSGRRKQLAKKRRFTADMPLLKIVMERQRKPPFDDSASSFQAMFNGLHVFARPGTVPAISSSSTTKSSPPTRQSNL